MSFSNTISVSECSSMTAHHFFSELDFHNIALMLQKSFHTIILYLICKCAYYYNFLFTVPNLMLFIVPAIMCILVDCCFVGTYRHISAHIGTYRHISAHIGTYRHISAHVGAYRHISVHISTYRSMLTTLHVCVVILPNFHCL